MKTINFFSYKGGLGRTLTLANVAWYLARLDFKVCIIDFDIEAPGIQFKFNIDKFSKINHGLVDLLYDRYTKTNKIRLDECFYDIPTKQGSIKILPCGNIDQNSYFEHLYNLDFKSIVYSDSGINEIQKIRTEIEEKYQPDFLLLDSRTGFTEIGILCTTFLSDSNIYFITNNEESAIGTNIFYNSVKLNREKLLRDPGESTFILSRIPLDFNTDIKKKFEEKVREIDNEVTHSYIHSSDALGHREVIILHEDNFNDPEINRDNKFKDLIDDYVSLINKFVNKDILTPRLEKITGNLIYKIIDDDANPDLITSEMEAIANNYPHTITFQRLIDIYRLRNESISKILTIYDKAHIFNFNFENKYIEYYIQYFISDKQFRPFLFNPELVEKYFISKEIKNLGAWIRLIKLLTKHNNYEKALELIDKIFLSKDEISDEILEQAFICYSFLKISNGGNDLYYRYSKRIERNKELSLVYLQFLEATEQYSSFIEILEASDLFDNYFRMDADKLYKIYKDTNGYEDFYLELESITEKYKILDDRNSLITIGRICHDIGIIKDFREIISDYIFADDIIESIFIKKGYRN